MSKEKTSLRQIQAIVPGDVINGFSPSFAKSLLEKLIRLYTDDNIWEERRTRVQEDASSTYCTRPVAGAIMGLLCDQIKFSPQKNYYGNSASFTAVNIIIEGAVEILTALGIEIETKPPDVEKLEAECQTQIMGILEDARSDDGRNYDEVVGDIMAAVKNRFILIRL